MFHERGRMGGREREIGSTIILYTTIILIHITHYPHNICLQQKQEVHKSVNFFFRIQSYVREQILQTVAVMIKRGTIDTHHTDKESLFNDVTQLISSGNISMVSVH